MTRSPSPAASSIVSDDESEKSFSDTEAFIHRLESTSDKQGSPPEENGWELDYIEDSRITILEEPIDKVERSYKLKFKGYEDSEWQPENNVDALELVRCFWENVLLGSEACIKAQQELLIQIENRPDSDEEDLSNEFNNKNNKNVFNTNTTNGYNQDSRKVTKKFKQLKPRNDRLEDSDLAESDSNSSCDGDDDSDEEPLIFPLAYSFSSEFLSFHHQNENSNLTVLNNLECSYQPWTPQIRKQMKCELGMNETNSSSSSLLDGIDLESIYAYEAKDPEIAEGIEIQKLIEEMKLDEIKEQNNQLDKKRHQKIKLKLKEKNQNIIMQTPMEVDIPVLANTSKSNEHTKNSTHGNKDKIINNENTINSTTSDLQKEKSKTQKNISTSILKCMKQNNQLEEIPRNLYHLNLSKASTSKDSSPTNLLSNESCHSSQPDRISSTQQLSEEEEEEEDPSIFHAVNPRIKRKFVDTQNMKFSTFNQQKKLCLRKKSIRWADQCN